MTTAARINPNPYLRRGFPSYAAIKTGMEAWVERVLHPDTVVALRDSDEFFRLALTAFRTEAKIEAGISPFARS